MAGTIQSSSAVAGQHAQAITSGVNSISTDSQVTKDSTSTIGGNATASGYIDNESSYASQVEGAINSFYSNLNSVASEFESVDAQTANSINNSSAGSSGVHGKDRNAAGQQH